LSFTISRADRRIQKVWKTTTTKQHQSSSPQSATVDNGPQIAALAEQVKELKGTVDVLISQIQMLRSDVTKNLGGSYLSLSSVAFSASAGITAAATYANSKSKAVALSATTTAAGCSCVVLLFVLVLR
jgi:hypothetical protein